MPSVWKSTEKEGFIMNPNENPKDLKNTQKKATAPKKATKATKKQKKPTYHQQRADELKKMADVHRKQAIAAYTQYQNCDHLYHRYKNAGRITAISAFLVRWAMKLTRKADDAYKALPQEVPAAKEAPTPTGNTGGMDWKAWCDGIDAQIAADKARSAVLPQVDD